MSTLIEVAANLVTSQLSKAPMSIEQIISEISRVHKGLTDLQSGKQVDIAGEAKQMSNKDYFLKNEIICMVCGKKGFKTLCRHLTTAHNITASMYRNRFGVPRTQPLTAKNYSQSRKKLALERETGNHLAKAREVRRTNIETLKATTESDESHVVEVAVAVGS